MPANPPVTVRLRPVLLAYIDELEDIGGYGKGRPGVIRRFVEDGVRRAIEMRVIEKRSGAALGEIALDSDE